MKTLLVAINAKFIHSNLAIRYLKAYSDKHITADIETIEEDVDLSADAKGSLNNNKDKE